MRSINLCVIFLCLGENSDDVAVRIAGGADEHIVDYPYMAYVRLVGKSQEYFCGGAIIGLQYILSAASCFEYVELCIM